MKNQQLYFVEFGKPDPPGFSSFSFSEKKKPLFVMASGYEEAAQKALAFASEKSENTPVVSYDGSLCIPSEEDELRVKSVKLVSDEIVW